MYGSHDTRTHATKWGSAVTNGTPVYSQLTTDELRKSPAPGRLSPRQQNRVLQYNPDRFLLIYYIRSHLGGVAVVRGSSSNPTR